MQQQGIPEEQIVSSLQEQGVSPKEIEDALNQSKVKSAVAGESDEPPQGQSPYSPQTQEMEEEYAPQSGDAGMQQDYYAQDQGGYAPATNDADTIIEISEQVFSEKIKAIMQQIEALNEFKALSQVKIDNLEERLKRIESIIDRMQVEIVNKVGNYGRE
jgi:DNA-binding transcriptional MerR regulator